MKLDAQINPSKNVFFSRNISIDVPVIANFIAIREWHQWLIDQNLMQHNWKIYKYNYIIWEQVMIKVYDPKKSQERLHGQYLITELNTNGTVRVWRDLYGYIEDPYNLWIIKPYT